MVDPSLYVLDFDLISSFTSFLSPSLCIRVLFLTFCSHVLALSRTRAVKMTTFCTAESLPIFFLYCMQHLRCHAKGGNNATDFFYKRMSFKA